MLDLTRLKLLGAADPTLATDERDLVIALREDAYRLNSRRIEVYVD